MKHITNIYVHAGDGAAPGNAGQRHRPGMAAPGRRVQAPGYAGGGPVMPAMPPGGLPGGPGGPVMPMPGGSSPGGPGAMQGGAPAMSDDDGDEMGGVAPAETGGLAPGRAAASLYRRMPERKRNESPPSKGKMAKLYSHGPTIAKLEPGAHVRGKRVVAPSAAASKDKAGPAHRRLYG